MAEYLQLGPDCFGASHDLPWQALSYGYLQP